MSRPVVVAIHGELKDIVIHRAEYITRRVYPHARLIIWKSVHERAPDD